MAFFVSRNEYSDRLLEGPRRDDAVVTYVRAHGSETGNPVSKVSMRVAGRVCLSVSGACL